MKGVVFVLGLSFSFLSHAAGAAAPFYSALLDKDTQTYVVVCENKTLQGVTYRQLVETDVCSEVLSSESPTKPFIKKAFYDFSKSSLTVKCAGNESLFSLTRLQGFRACEPQNQYKSFARASAGVAPSDYSVEVSVCLLNDLNQIVCKNGLPTLSGFRNESGYQFSYKELSQNAASGLSLAKWLPDHETKYTPVDRDNPLLQIFEMSSNWPVFTEPGEEFESLVFAPAGICALETHSQTLRCWQIPLYSAKEDDPASVFAQSKFKAKGIEGDHISSAKLTPYFRSTKAVKNFFFGREGEGYKSARILYVKYVDGSYGRFFVKEKGMSDPVEVVEDTDPGLQVPDEITDILENAGAASKTNPLLDENYHLVFEPGHFDHQETPLEGTVYKTYLKGLSLTDYYGSFEYSCFIERKTGQPACVMISSGAG